MKLKCLRLLSFFIMVIFFAIVCTNRKKETITFAVGGAPAELDFWEELISEFTDETGVKVDMIRHPTDTDMRRQSLVTSLKSKESNPDIFLMDIAWVGQFAASHWLEPLEEFINASKVNTDVFFDQVVKQADRYENNLIALPVYIDGGLLYYRKDLLEKYGYNNPPKTWNQLVEYSLKIMQEERKENDRFYGFVWQGAQYEGLICTFLEFAGSNDGGISIDNKGVSINTPANREAVVFMRDLIHKHQISPPSTYTEMKEEEVRIFFQNGNALFERNWPYAWQLHQAEDSKVKAKVGISSLPHFEGKQSASTLGGWHIGISKYSDEKSLSWMLLKYLISYKIQKKLFLELGWNPGRKDVYNDTEILEYMPHFTKLKDVFQHAIARPNVPYYSVISNIFQRNLNSVLAGKKQVEDVFAKSEKEIQNAVSRYAQDK